MTLLSVTEVSKGYGGLRPLRVRAFALSPGEQVALAGFDRTTAEVFVNLVTGATLPETGEVHAFGRRTADISDSAEWLQMVDRFGIVSQRVVLLEPFTLAQNIAMSLTLDVEPIPADTVPLVERLAGEVGLSSEALERTVEASSEAVKHRVRLARALATEPTVLLVEHPSADVPPAELSALAEDLRRAAGARGVSLVVLAATAEVGRPFAGRVLVLNAATGELSEARPGALRRMLGWGG